MRLAIKKAGLRVHGYKKHFVYHIHCMASNAVSCGRVASLIHPHRAYMVQAKSTNYAHLDKPV